MKFRFEVDESKWNLVSDKGLPQDDEWCLLVWKNEDADEYDYHVGAYCEEDDIFYVDFGLGGLEVDADSVVAWAPLFEGNDGYLKVLK